MSEHGVIGVLCCDHQGLALAGQWISVETKLMLKRYLSVYQWFSAKKLNTNELGMLAQGARDY